MYTFSLLNSSYLLQIDTKEKKRKTFNVSYNAWEKSWMISKVVSNERNKFRVMRELLG